MKIFLKAQLSSFIATAVDFGITIFLVEILQWQYALAVFAGALGGACSNFFVNRFWSFEVSEKSLKTQGLRYVLVWTGSVLLNVSGVYLMANIFKVNYIVSKIVVSIVVGLSFNYLLQKKFVFAK